MIYDGLHRHRSRSRRRTPHHLHGVSSLSDGLRHFRKSEGSKGQEAENGGRDPHPKFTVKTGVSEPPAPRSLARLPSRYRNGMDGKSGILCEREREGGGRTEMERHSWERWTTDGRTERNERMRGGEGAAAVVRGGIHGGSLHAAQRKAATAALCEGGSGGRMEKGAHLTPMEWAKERASEHDPRARRAFRCIRQAGLRWRRELGRVLPDPLGILPEGWMQE